MELTPSKAEIISTRLLNLALLVDTTTAGVRVWERKKSTMRLNFGVLESEIELARVL